MENSLEYQRRQLWIDIYRDYIKSGIYGFDQCVKLADNALAEFDKRFKEPEKTGMMGEDEFNKWSEKETNRMINSRCDREQTDYYFSGAWAAYKLLTGKE